MPSRPRTPPRVPRSVRVAAAALRRDLHALARPAGAFDPSRYFRTTEPMTFLNVRTPVVRRLARDAGRRHRAVWTLTDALAFTGCCSVGNHWN